MNLLFYSPLVRNVCLLIASTFFTSSLVYRLSVIFVRVLQNCLYFWTALKCSTVLILKLNDNNNLRMAWLITLVVETCTDLMREGWLTNTSPFFTRTIFLLHLLKLWSFGHVWNIFFNNLKLNFIPVRILFKKWFNRKKVKGFLLLYLPGVLNIYCWNISVLKNFV